MMTKALMVLAFALAIPILLWMEHPFIFWLIVIAGGALLIAGVCDKLHK